MDTGGKLYLGRLIDPTTGKPGEQPLMYDPEDLTTHGIVVGMTGSGKTGLSIGLLEEAALQGIPALLIDPKGDLTNALLHFPDLATADFLPWINADVARRNNQTVEEAAAETAQTWAKGLADWGIEPSRIQALKDSAQFAVFTPGSDTGIPLSILASLQAPKISWSENREMLLEQISGTVTGLLGLVGVTDIDPVRSREHILLSKIFENAWSQGRDLTLEELILQTQTPPFPKLGVFDVNTFFPEKDRFGLAMSLNNILASPSFQAWISGQPLDVPGLLYTPEGKPRHSVFYIAHLSESERMFFVTLLFSAIETWMRAQSGTTTLRALLYFDEIFGYLPPLGNPPSKTILLRMLKQARAFGVGLLLATQNPVDVDYKALSNAGSWFIGKLQTDQDKVRLLDGLQGAAPGIDRSTYDRLISSLGKRVFLMHNVHEKQPVTFSTRWVMNYLPGPLTRTQIPLANKLAGAKAVSAPAAVPPDAQPQTPSVSQPSGVTSSISQPVMSAPASIGGTATRPKVPGKVDEFFLPNNLTVSQAFRAFGKTMPAGAAAKGLLYRPVLVGQARIRILQRKYNLDTEVIRTTLVREVDPRGFIRWEEFPAEPLDYASFDQLPDASARFNSLEAPLNDEKRLAELKRDFEEWAFHSGEVKLWANETLNVYAGPDTTEAGFRQLTSDAAHSARDAEVEKVERAFEKKMATLQDKADRLEREVDSDKSEYDQRKLDELGNAAETIFKLFGGRKKSLSTGMTKRRLTSKAKSGLEDSEARLEDVQSMLAALEEEKAAAIAEVNDRWGTIAQEITHIPLLPTKANVRLELFGIAWMPFHIIDTPSGQVEMPGFGRA